jgi:hypothetical protein
MFFNAGRDQETRSLLIIGLDFVLASTAATCAPVFKHSSPASTSVFKAFVLGASRGGATTAHQERRAEEQHRHDLDRA